MIFFNAASVLLFYPLAAIASDTTLHPLSDEFIDLINSQNLWKAGRNFHQDVPLSYFKGLMGALPDEHFSKLEKKQHDLECKKLPKNFDAREKWPQCPSLNDITDQGSCGGCWAFAATEAMSDRYCITSNGTMLFHFSPQDLLSCCQYCGMGCGGGSSRQAWEYWKNYGIVSGGSYKSNEGCRPLDIPPCIHTLAPYTNSCKDEMKTPICNRTCQDAYGLESYELDKRYGKNAYAITGEENIKAELFTNGPVEASMMVYADFLSYKSGVYQHLYGDELGGHAVKIIGWGKEDGKNYWLVANSWNTQWGELGGFFKIRRGKNESGIENEFVAGEPIVQYSPPMK